MRLRFPSRMGRRLTGFLILSLGAHAVAFSIFRDPGVFPPIPPPGPGKVTLSHASEEKMGMASLFEPSAIVLPADQPKKLAMGVTWGWSDLAWPTQDILSAPVYRPTGLGQDAPLAVRAATSIGSYHNQGRESAAVSSERAVPQSWFELSGDLKQRKQTKSIRLPAMKSANALEPTTARIGVDEDGAVRFVCLEGSTGDLVVDREASNLLRSWRFEPAPGKWVEWGRVRILWAVDIPAEAVQP
ncbi:MAG: energy transducer TonB [Verrucomicrobia bacterium]|nr:energy transducer TonB [Verrucomicrobiota bacterium]